MLQTVSAGPNTLNGFNKCDLCFMLVQVTSVKIAKIHYPFCFVCLLRVVVESILRISNDSTIFY